MLKEKIQMISAFVAPALVISVLIGSVQITTAQENQTAVNGTAQVEGAIDQLLLAQPILSELMDEEDTGVNQYLNELDTQDAVHTVLALKALQSLIELQSSYMMAEGLGNQTGVVGNQTVALANQTMA